ncbi:MAG: biosynthetic peptidoglycan transglycosylase [Daejeonella sp.]
MKLSGKHYRIASFILLSLVVLLSIGAGIAYNKRELILKTVIEKVINKAKRDYNLNVKIKDAHFTGLKTVEFTDVSVVPDKRDSLITIKNFSVGIKLFPLFFGNFKPSEIKLNNAKINLIKKDSTSNFDFLFRKKKTDSSKESTKVSLAELANKLLSQLLSKIPYNMDISNLEIKFTQDTTVLSFNTTKAIIDHGRVNSTIKVNRDMATWHVQGEVDPDDKQLNLMLFAEDKKVELPYIEQKFGLKLNFDTISTEIRRVKYSGDELKISGLWSVKNMLINHPRIAGNDIIVPNGSIETDMLIGENFIAVDSSSTIRLKNIEAHPFLKYTLHPKKIYELKLHTDELEAQQLFDAFPQGLFESLEGIQVAGKLQYDLNFYLDTKQPDQVVFDSRLIQRGFKITKWGKTNLQKINNSFIYTPYEYGKPMRNITIGLQNPNYTPIEEVSSYLKNALLTAEDPSFYTHHGFVEESIRKSIATNFKEKAFKRGGSTISMQLVKNVYLSRQKTLARKIEEILLVWIIENSRLSSKQRMFEAYLNLIEWGPNVYGIGEASRYYFSKHPSQLNLGESIFLASIVPKPKSALYSFQSDGSLRGGLYGYFNLIGGLMANKGMAQADSSAYGFYSVRLKESLRRPSSEVDSLVTDTLTDEEENGGGILQRLFGRSKRDTITVKSNKLRTTPRDTIPTPDKRKRKRESSEMEQ